MPVILNLETATKVCSVALAKDGEIVALREHFGDYAHAEKLTVFVEETLKEAKLSFSDLDAIAVSKGPGSYTGLRIGVSAAKGFAFTLDIPVIAVSTLENMAIMAIKALREKKDFHYKNYLLCPMIDARRMEVYCAVYAPDLSEIKPVSAEIIDNNSFADLLNENKTCFFGDGSQKCREALGDHPNAIFLDDIYPSASAMAPLALNAFNNKIFEDTAYFEPFYLKEFMTTVPRSKI